MRRLIPFAAHSFYLAADFAATDLRGVDVGISDGGTDRFKDLGKLLRWSTGCATCDTLAARSNQIRRCQHPLHGCAAFGFLETSRRELCGVEVGRRLAQHSGRELLVDFLLGDAVKIFAKFQYGHFPIDYRFKRCYQDQVRTVEQLEKDSAKWEKLPKEITQR